MNCNETIKLTFGPCHTRYKCPCSRKLILKRVSAMVCVIIPFDKSKFYLLIHKVREEEYFFQALVLIFKCLRFHYLHINIHTLTRFSQRTGMHVIFWLAHVSLTISVCQNPMYYFPRPMYSMFQFSPPSNLPQQDTRWSNT